jgi:hypothetical protein
MESADAHQLGKTVDLLSKVHNVKQALIRIFPCLKHVFAPTLYDYIGTDLYSPYHEGQSLLATEGGLRKGNLLIFIPPTK